MKHCIEKEISKCFLKIRIPSLDWPKFPHTSSMDWVFRAQWAPGLSHHTRPQIPVGGISLSNKKHKRKKWNMQCVGLVVWMWQWPVIPTHCCSNEIWIERIPINVLLNKEWCYVKWMIVVIWFFRTTRQRDRDRVWCRNKHEEELLQCRVLK